MKIISETINTDTLTVEQIRKKQQEQLKMIEKAHSQILEGQTRPARELLKELEKENEAILHRTNN